MKKSEVIKAVQEVLREKKRPGLWANINAKRKRGEKPSHGNSQAHKDAVAAGNAMKKEGEHQGSNYKWPMSQATKDRKEADVAAQKALKAKETDTTEAIEDSSAGTEAYYDIRALIQKHARNLSDDDAYTMHELLKDFFNKAI